MLKCEIKRSMLNKDLVKQIEFMIENKPGVDRGIAEAKRVTFAITPDSLQNVKTVSVLG